MTKRGCMGAREEVRVDDDRALGGWWVRVVNGGGWWAKGEGGEGEGVGG